MKLQISLNFLAADHRSKRIRALGFIILSAMVACLACGPVAPKYRYLDRSNPHTFPACPGSLSTDHRRHAYQALFLAQEGAGAHGGQLFENVPNEWITLRYCYREETGPCVDMVFEAMETGSIRVYNISQEATPRNFMDNIWGWLSYLQQLFQNYSCLTDDQLMIELQRRGQVK